MRQTPTSPTVTSEGVATPARARLIVAVVAVTLAVIAALGVLAGSVAAVAIAVTVGVAAAGTAGLVLSRSWGPAAVKVAMAGCVAGALAAFADGPIIGAAATIVFVLVGIVCFVVDRQFSPARWALPRDLRAKIDALPGVTVTAVAVPGGADMIATDTGTFAVISACEAGDGDPLTSAGVREALERRGTIDASLKRSGIDVGTVKTVVVVTDRDRFGPARNDDVTVCTLNTLRKALGTSRRR